ncbi:MAG: hypothetical protein AAF399_28970 [Bacteroidota bacterium]
MRALIVIVFACWLSPVWGQSIEATLAFDSDTTAVGRLQQVVMEIFHPEDIVVVFPLNKEAFLPFELVSQEAEPTRTEEGKSIDRVIYQVRTFELKEKQALRLPYAYLPPGTQQQDTSWEYVSSDTIRLKARIAEEQAADSLEAFGELDQVSEPPDYSLLTILGIILLIMLVPLGIFLRGPIQRYLRLQGLKQEWQSIRKEIKGLGKQTDQAEVLNQLNRIWKHYLDPDDTVGLRSMTTTELQIHIPELMFLTRPQQEILLKLSQVSDQVIYAGEHIQEDVISGLTWELYEVIDATYQERKEGIRV